jgi:hypothetical protein
LNPCGLPFTIAAGTRQRTHSRVWVPRNSWPYFAVSVSRLPQPGGSGPCIDVPQWQDGPVILRAIGFPCHRLLRLEGLRWRYSNPPPHGPLCCNIDVPLFIGWGDIFRFTLLLPQKREKPPSLLHP